MSDRKGAAVRRAEPDRRGAAATQEERSCPSAAGRVASGGGGGVREARRGPRARRRRGAPNRARAGRVGGGEIRGLALRVGRVAGDHPTAERGAGFVYLDPNGQTGPRPGHAQPHHAPRDPAGVAGRLDLPRPARAHPGGRAGRPRPQAVPVSRALAAGPRRGQVRADDRSSCGPSRAIRRRVGARPAQARACRARRCSRRSCGCWRRRFIRVGNEEYTKQNKSYGLTTIHNHHAKVARLEHPLPLPRQERRRARDRPGGPAAGEDRPRLPGPARRGALRLPGRRRAAPTTSARPTSTPTCRRSPARTSPPRTSAPGPARCWRRGRCRSSRPSTARRGGRRTSSRPSSRSPRSWATPGPSAASATSTRR